LLEEDQLCEDDDGADFGLIESYTNSTKPVAAKQPQDPAELYVTGGGQDSGSFPMLQINSFNLKQLSPQINRKPTSFGGAEYLLDQQPKL
jgi:hypothetical protein